MSQANEMASKQQDETHQYQESDKPRQETQVKRASSSNEPVQDHEGEPEDEEPQVYEPEMTSAGAKPDSGSQSDTSSTSMLSSHRPQLHSMGSSLSDQRPKVPLNGTLTGAMSHMHVCRLCDKLLSSSSSLDRHMLTHSGERPFVCKRCHMTFTTNGK